MPSVSIEDGVVHEIVILDPGSGYADDINYSIEEALELEVLDLADASIKERCKKWSGGGISRRSWFT